MVGTARAAAASGAAEAAAARAAAAEAALWAGLVGQLARGLDRASRLWTAARRKESLQRVLESSRRDPRKLQERLSSLLRAWDDGLPADEADAADAAGPAGADVPPTATPVAPPEPGRGPEPWSGLVASLHGTLRQALPAGEPRAEALADTFQQLADRIAREGATPELADAVEQACVPARRLLAHRHHLVDALLRLTRELGQGLVELAEDESWAQGQASALRERLSDGASARAVRAAEELLAEARGRQGRLRAERHAAQEALKATMRQLLAELAGLSEQTGRFEAQVARHAEAIAGADSLQRLAGVVQALVEDSRAARSLLTGAHERLAGGHARAGELEARVRTLEGELRRLSEEVSTDALTQVANRRGLQAAFEAVCVRAPGGEPAPGEPRLAVGLIDIDNFKRLNDSLGHAAGDKALQALAAAVRERLRPQDTVARFGGEEFVLLLPDSSAEEAQRAVSRLQRELTASLFLHEQREVFVTFSAGVTAWRAGEALEGALERADEALYEAKRTGKNRTCLS